MGVNETVFPSKRERRHFEHLRDRWSSKYRLYANLPFLTVFNTDKLYDFQDPYHPQKIEISIEDFNRLKKTSIDFTICTENDKPLLCIEFDGINQGTNVGGRYVVASQASPWRKIITELKLRISHASLFPFFIMASSQFEVIDATDKLAIVDCVIGSVLASSDMADKFSVGFNPEEANMSQEEFSALSKEEQWEVVQDWGLGVEIEAQFNNNPLYDIVYSLQERLQIRKMSYGFLENPELAGVFDPKERATILDQVSSVGAQAWVELPDGRRAIRTVWIPNFQTPGFSPYGFLDELATYAALKKAEKILKRDKNKRRSHNQS